MIENEDCHIRIFPASASKNEIEKVIKNKRAIYNLKTDKRSIKFGDGEKLEKYPLEKLPKFLQNNLKNYQKWID